ncbi:ferritin-like protein [Longilinea arvoryzae]|uniref:Ferritin n=1 Tax=Longilinea arvoryzae TaxID=360412 RepID=A0A0S7BLX4_9CHLR|nr:ferritin [Longilinea arvoryzae]GAP15510.1 ferritin-like protein [Longilinea arvoryzae]
MSMISKELNDEINAQIGREFAASLQYNSIAVHFDTQALKKLAGLFYKQAAEENEHAMKFIKYVVEAGGDVIIPTVAAPKAKFAAAEEAIGLALKWEEDVTDQINHLMDIAVAKKDYLGQQFLNWYVNEQLEEVSTMRDLLQIVQRVGEKNLVMMEAYLAHGD